MLILASTSPRRIQLLNEVGLKFEVRSPGTDESRRPRETPKAMVARLACEKAQSVMTEALREFGVALIIGADTTVVAPGNGQVLGKPTSTGEAEKMLRSLTGKTHTVLTGYCILSAARGQGIKKLIRVISSKVMMRKLDRGAIARYVATGEPMDKAGSYAAQGMGMALIERIQGSYTNVVGLPMTQVLSDLESKFGMPIFSWRDRS